MTDEEKQRALEEARITPREAELLERHINNALVVQRTALAKAIEKMPLEMHAEDQRDLAAQLVRNHR